MSVEWYYVEGEQRIGPVSQSKISELIEEGNLTEENFVWKKGFENWKKLKEVSDFKRNDDYPEELPTIVKSSEKRDVDWDVIKDDEKIFLIKIGIDRGGEEVEYGPYSINILKRAAIEGRINGKTLLFVSGMDSWTFLSDLPIYNKIFSTESETLSNSERRQNSRKPFVARMFFHNESVVYEGICRDISVGGLQVLVDGFPGNIGDEISLNVHPENTDYNFVASGKVVRILEGDQGFSLRFIKLSDEAINAIEDYLSKN